jgi:hypothetical protein
VTRVAAVAALLVTLFATVIHAEPRRVIVREVPGADVPANAVEIRGVAAGPFDPAIWQAGKLHLLPDARSPLLTPRDGKFRNIYAPSIVQTKTGWDVYFGGWDGVTTGNDRIYRVSTPDFLTFGERRTVIEHGVFQHVCNVSVDRLPGESLAMLCTTYPDAKGLNKPAFFESTDGERWNHSLGAHVATRADVITIDGYEGYAGADVNGMNVLLHDGGVHHMYFCNFRDGGKVFRATSADGMRYAFDGVALTGVGLVNDVKKFRTRVGTGDDAADTWYLMGLHLNGDRLWYALSRDGKTFEPPPRVLCTSLGAADAHIVSVGFVVAGEQERVGRRVLGFLYGAGAAPTLDANRIFARWLQKRVVIAIGDERFEPTRAVGPDRQIVKISRAATVPLELYAEDAVTLIGRSVATPFEPGRAYELVLE